MNPSVSPYVVFRRARLPLQELSALVPESTWVLLDDALHLKESTKLLGEELSDELATEIPRRETAERRLLANARRDIHNGRTTKVRSRIGELDAALTPGTAARLQAWLTKSEDYERLEAAAEQSYATENAAARATFPALLQHDAMAASLQLSGDRLLTSITDLAHGRLTGAKPSRIRTIETSWINFLYRAAMKPSPFGRFTEIGAFDPYEANAPVPTNPEPRSHIAVNRVILNWLLSSLRALPGGDTVGHFLINNTLVLRKDSVQFLGTDPKATSFSDSETVLTLRRDHTIDSVLRMLTRGSAPAQQLATSLGDDIGDPDVAARTLTALERIGLLAFRPPIEEQDSQYTEKLNALLRNSDHSAVHEIQKHVEHLTNLEHDFGDASLELRSDLLSRASDAIQQISTKSTVPPPDPDSMRTLVYEDIWTPSGPISWGVEAVTEHTAAFDALWTLASLLDHGQTQRISLYDFARKQFPNADTISLADLVAAYVSLSEGQRDSLLAGRGIIAAEEHASARAAALHEIRESIDHRDGIDHLDPSTLLDICRKVTSNKVPRSLTFRLQFSHSGDSMVPVVNGVFTGFGAYFSRFSRVIGASTPDGWRLDQAVRSHLQSVHPNQTDLNAVFGFNFNLHPNLTSTVLNYPGSWPASVPESLTLTDIDVVLEHQFDNLALRNKNTGQPLEFLPMNFLISVGMPPLYQLLDALSPTTRYPWQLASHVRDGLESSSFPDTSSRLQVGGVVADRRTWTFRASEIQELEELHTDSLEPLKQFDRWRREQNLPRHAFVLCQTLDEYNALTGRTGGIPLKWATFEHLHRASVHKPMYVDFRNPFLVRSFAKAAKSRPELYVSIRECLPHAEEYINSKPPRSPEEFFVEFYRK